MRRMGGVILVLLDVPTNALPMPSIGGGYLRRRRHRKRVWAHRRRAYCAASILTPKILPRPHSDRANAFGATEVTTSIANMRAMATMGVPRGFSNRSCRAQRRGTTEVAASSLLYSDFDAPSRCELRRRWGDIKREPRNRRRYGGETRGARRAPKGYFSVFGSDGARSFGW